LLLLKIGRGLIISTKRERGHSVSSKRGRGLILSNKRGRGLFVSNKRAQVPLVTNAAMYCVAQTSVHRERFHVFGVKHFYNYFGRLTDFWATLYMLQQCEMTEGFACPAACCVPCQGRSFIRNGMNCNSVPLFHTLFLDYTLVAVRAGQYERTTNGRSVPFLYVTR
jgi:hypothetical protein